MNGRASCERCSQAHVGGVLIGMGLCALTGGLVGLGVGLVLGSLL